MTPCHFSCILVPMPLKNPVTLCHFSLIFWPIPLKNPVTLCHFSLIFSPIPLKNPVTFFQALVIPAPTLVKIPLKNPVTLFHFSLILSPILLKPAVIPSHFFLNQLPIFSNTPIFFSPPPSLADEEILSGIPSTILTGTGIGIFSNGDPPESDPLGINCGPGTSRDCWTGCFSVSTKSFAPSLGVSAVGSVLDFFPNEKIPAILLNIPLPAVCALFFGINLSSNDVAKPPPTIASPLIRFSLIP